MLDLGETRPRKVVCLRLWSHCVGILEVVLESIRLSFMISWSLHRGSVLSPLLIIIVLEPLPRELRLRFPEELLYADDLAIVSESPEVLKGRLEIMRGSLN